MAPGFFYLFITDFYFQFYIYLLTKNNTFVFTKNYETSLEMQNYGGEKLSQIEI